MKDFDAVVVGELNVDIILGGLAGLPELGQEKLARDMLFTLGSSSAIFAHNLSRLGRKVVFCGKAGDDVHGRYVVQALSSVGVNTSGIILDRGLKTGLTVSLTYPRDRALVTFPGAMEHLTAAEIDFSLIGRARHLHVSSYFLQAGLQRDLPALFKRAKELGLTTSLDPGHDPDDKWGGLFELLPHVDVFLPNEEEALRIAGAADLGAAGLELARYAGLVVVKKGTDGAVAWNGPDSLSTEGYDAEVVDTTGAGDSFNAGFIHKFLEGRPLEECLEFGAACGAIACTYLGGTLGFPDPDKIEEFMSSHKRLA
ncbi:MAG TPA: carbohydrate kinase family protein [Firmicutes bacterium]|nr:carbohydrate kinase family protein [Bacillota bacterium]